MEALIANCIDMACELARKVNHLVPSERPYARGLIRHTNLLIDKVQHTGDSDAAALLVDAEDALAQMTCLPCAG